MKVCNGPLGVGSLSVVVDASTPPCVALEKLGFGYEVVKL
jgi:hypothetical protein